MKKSIKVVLILLWVCMIIVGISACGDSAGIDKEDLIDTPIAKEMSYVSATLPNAQVSLEDETGVEGDLSGHDNTLSTEDNIVEHEKAGYCDNTVTKISRESQMGRESCEVSFDGSDSVALTDLLLYLDYSDGICRCQPEYNVDTEFGTGYGINLTEGYVRHDVGQVSLTAEQLELIQGIFDRQVSMAQGEEKAVSPDQTEIFKAVLLGDSPFIYCHGGNVETMVITDVPALFDEDDPLMKFWEFSVIDLNGDGEDEVILFVVGVAGDMGGKGGKVVFHQIGDKVYGYTTDNRTLVDLKIDGTYDYSDPTGVAEAGIATVRGFSETEYTVDKITYATGTYKGWDTFVADHQSVTEEEYLDAVSKQDQKQNAEWHEFTDENINTLF